MASMAMQAYERHVAALTDRDLDAVVDGYAADAVLTDTDRIGQGHDHIRAVFAETMDAAMNMEPQTRVFEQGDVVFVSWRAPRSGHDDLVGGETFVTANGLITVHTSFVTSTADPQPASGL